jgi:cation:H+ antiporter
VPRFTETSLLVNVAVFALAAALVWAAGKRVARYADIVAEQTGIGQALAGMLLMAIITSLPEVAVSASAAATGDPALGVNDVIGSASVNIVILALADAVIGRDALTSVLGDPVVLMQGAFGILLFGVVAGVVILGDAPVAGAGAGAWTLLVLYVLMVRTLSLERARTAWTAQPRNVPLPRVVGPPRLASDAEREPLRPIAWKLAAAAAAILVAGFLLSRTGEAIAEQTGLGTSFVGAVLVAFSTSLPEVSTVLEAMRLGRYTMAVSDVFGTNLANVCIIFVADIIAEGEPVLARVGDMSAFGAILAIVLTSIYLAGLVERHNKTVARLGLDSVVVLVTYAAGVVMLYSLR